MVKKLDKAYIAGFFDGEGSIIIYKRSRSNSYSLNVQVNQLDRGMLEFLQSFYSGKINRGNDKKKKHQLWQWRLTAQMALNFLLDIEPFLKLKREQAKLAIKFQRTKKLRGNSLTVNELQVEQGFYQNLKELKFVATVAN